MPSKSDIKILNYVLLGDKERLDSVLNLVRTTRPTTTLSKNTIDYLNAIDINGCGAWTNSVEGRQFWQIKYNSLPDKLFVSRKVKTRRPPFAPGTIVYSKILPPSLCTMKVIAGPSSYLWEAYGLINVKLCTKSGKDKYLTYGNVMWLPTSAIYTAPPKPEYKIPKNRPQPKFLKSEEVN